MPLPTRLHQVKTAVISKLSDINQKVSKKNKIIGLCLMTVAAGLALTNPKQEDYIDYFSNELTVRAAEKCDNIHQRIDINALFLRIPAQDACELTVSYSTRVLNFLLNTEKRLARNTERTNFLLFSLYSTKDPLPFSDKTTKTIGIGRQFITYSRE